MDSLRLTRRECKQPLVQIDNRRKHLTGCMTCNIWWSADDKKVRISDEDLRALHQMPSGASAEAWPAPRGNSGGLIVLAFDFWTEWRSTPSMSSELFHHWRRAGA